MVKIIELDKPNHKKIKMTCDEILHEKLMKYPMTADAFSTNCFNLILGRMGQGKTSWVTNLVKHEFRKVFETIFLIMPASSRQSIDDDIFGKNLPSEQLYDDLNESVLEDIYSKLQENTSEGYNSLLLIDDFQNKMKDPEISKALEKIVIKIRHLRCTVFYLVQNFQKIPKSLRELSQNIITFNLGKSQLLKLFDEIIQMKKEKYDEIIEVCFKNQHDWILINLHKSKNIYRNWDLVEI